MTTFKEHLEEELRDPAFRRVWEESELARQVGRAVLKLRLDLGLTQEELAGRAGVPTAAVARLESGVGTPSLRLLHKVARGCGFQIKIELVPRRDRTGN